MTNKFSNLLSPLTAVKIDMKKLVLAVAFLTFTISVSAQDKPDRGFQPANSYSISDIENVNLTNGNLMMNIPLASVPGRGSGPGVAISARYDSKLWNTRSYTETDGSGAPDAGGYTYERVMLQRNGDDNYPSGGWFIDTGGYRLTSLNRSYMDSDAAEPACEILGQGVGQDNWAKNAYLYKLEMHMPDGSIKEFRPYGTGAAYDDPYELGYYSINENGARLMTTYTDRQNGGATCDEYWSQITTSGMNYYSSDGSGTRLYIPYNANDHWTLFMPNGSKVENLPTDDTSLTQRLTDRNGNHIYWKPATLNSQSGQEVVNDVGQYVFLYGDSSGNTVVEQPGVGGNLLSTTLHWTTTYVNRQYQSAWAANANYGHLYDTIEDSLGNLDSITLPSQVGSRQYTFTYHGSTTAQTGTNYTDGFGELKTVTLPTGATAEYSFNLDTSTKIPLSSEPRTGVYYTNTDGNVTGNFVKQRVLTYASEYDGSSSTVSETTTYGSDYFLFTGSVTGPDGSTTTQLGGGLSTTFPVRVTHPDGSVTENIWANNNAPKVNANTSIWHITGTNAYIKTQFTSIPNASGTLTYTAIKDYDYDKNGNVLAVREYDWVPYGDVAGHSGGGLPTGAIPASATLLRQTVNTYYNPTPIATDTGTDSPYHYANPSSPKLHNVIKSTEIQNGNGTAKARTEFFYDDPSNTGNLIETRIWDNTKGTLSAPDANGSELNAGNSISTFATYNSFGEPIQTKDANGVQTTITYGCIDGNASCDANLTNLYPTKTEAASNSTLKRTSTASYDFYTGLVTTATDADNNLSTVTTYDDLGRPTKVATAAGTALEGWTQTQYYDGTPTDHTRYVVVKSDIEAKGDGRNVATQFFDQLGRVRLAKTLEDASAQSATNETDGVKVQTRYKSDYDSSSHVGHSYQLTSNPYRASISSGASGEPTMGWTLSTALSTGHHSEVQTFSGVGLPAPWSANANSTGVVQTDTDSNATTVTDQTGKVRRSVTNGIGQLIRVDEPTSSGLGAVSSPNQKTDYTYDVLNNLLTVTQAGSGTEQCGPNGGSCSQTRTFVYSSLSRLTSATNPESGTINYIYDFNGNLTRKTDARGVQTDYVYDALNRVTNRNYSTPSGTPLNYQASPNITYTYGTTAPAIGKLTKVSSSVSTTEYTSFDILGRVTGAKQTTDGGDAAGYTTAYTYKLNGALDEETYPSTRVVKNELDPNGDLLAVESKKNSTAGFWRYADTFTYNAAGAVTSMQLGNGRWESTVFNARLQPTQIALGAVQNGTDQLKLNYDYGTTANNGNVLTQTITVPTVGSNNGFVAVQNYSYDPLNRLKDATEDVTPNGGTASQSWKQTFSFDRYGNRRFDEANTTMPSSFANQALTDPSVNTANNRLNSTGWTYDTAGNTTADPNGQVFSYDGENKQVLVTNGSGTVGQYWYDGDGKRVKKYVPSTGETTVFVYDAAGKEIAEYSTIVANSTDAKVSYLTADHLGSPRINTDQNGSVIARHDYLPFGEEIDGAGGRTTGLNYGDDSVRKQFTGYERDNEVELDFGQSRYYSSKVGRFYSVDPENWGADETDAQSWNAYSYARNNPHVLVDPDGREYTICNNDKSQCYTYSDNDVVNLKKDPSVGKFVGDFDVKTGLYSGVIQDDQGNIVGSVQQTSIDNPIRRMAQGGANTLNTWEPVIDWTAFAECLLFCGPVLTGEAPMTGFIIGSTTRTTSNVIAPAGESLASSILSGISKTNLKHIAKHLSEFQRLDSSMTLEKVVELGKNILSKGVNTSSRLSNATFEESVMIGGQQVTVKVVLNSEGAIRSIHLVK
jgi:RHS repeat-associated protein